MNEVLRLLCRLLELTIRNIWCNISLLLAQMLFVYSRVMRSHGHTLEELWRLRHGEVNERIPDVVVFPRNHDDVVKLVAAAVRFNVCLIPIGGGKYTIYIIFNKKHPRVK